MKKIIYSLFFIATCSLVYSSDYEHIFSVPVKIAFPFTDYNGLLDDCPDIASKNEIEDGMFAKSIKKAYSNLFTKQSDSSTAKIIPVLRFIPNSEFTVVKDFSQ